jgi:phosphoinositide-3-kinase regulatory subunit 4
LTHKTQLAMAAADSAGCHRDAILALACVNLSSQRLISASSDGAVKVWK